MVVFGREYFFGGMGIQWCQPVSINSCTNTDSICSVYSIVLSGWNNIGSTSQDTGNG